MTTAVVSVSGGKDSTATALLAIDRYGLDHCRLVFADTGNEHEKTYQYIDELGAALGRPIETVRADFTKRMAKKRDYVAKVWPGKGVPDEIIQSALDILAVPTGVPFLDLCLWKGRAPSRKAQFCTQELKRYPLEAYMFDLILHGHHTLESWQGVRRAESQARAHLPARERAAEGWLIVRPIIDWSAAQVVYLIQARGIPLNPLYRQGMRRVGCMPCINAGKDELAEIARRFPEHIDKIREWERIMGLAAKRGFTTFFSGGVQRSHTPKAGYVYRPDKDTGDGPWMEGQALIQAAYCVDARIDWAMTARGGRQYDLLKTGEAPMCASVYGLCE